jgi:hypothetical protein
MAFAKWQHRTACLSACVSPDKVYDRIISSEAGLQNIATPRRDVLDVGICCSHHQQAAGNQKCVAFAFGDRLGIGVQADHCRLLHIAPACHALQYAGDANR